jgi:3-hydroxyacyl-CoA dehydrogenase
MGSGIAADLVNAGWSVYLLDVTEERAAAGIERINEHNPPLLFESMDRKRIVPRSMAEATESLACADWIVEAVAEDMTVKRDVLSLIEAYAPPSSPAIPAALVLPRCRRIPPQTFAAGSSGHIF